MTMLPLEPSLEDAVRDKDVVLAVDDDPLNLQLLHSTFKKSDFILASAYSGQEAVDYMLQHRVSLLLMDVHMPGMDGFQTVEAIRAYDHLKHVPVVFITAVSTASKMVQRGFEIGAYDYLIKPINLDLLKNKISTFLQIGRYQQSMRSLNETLEKAVAKRTEELTCLNKELHQEIQQRKALELELRNNAYQAGQVEANRAIMHNIGNAITGISGRAERMDVTFVELYKISTLIDKIHTSLQENPLVVQERSLDKILQTLNAIAMAIKELTNNTLQPQLKHILSNIKYISDILEMRRGLDTDKIWCSSFQLADMIEESHQILEILAQKHSVSINKDVDSQMEEVNLPESPFQQMLINLIKNSIEAIVERKNQHSFDGELNIKVTRATDSRYFYLTLEDNGCGVESEFVTAIFRPGYTTKEQGTGIGLHSAATFIQSIGGEINLESQGLNQGTKIIIRLPFDANKK